MFFKGKTNLRIKKIRAARAIFENELGTQEIELTVLTDNNERITFQMPPQLAHKLVTEVGSAYEAIAPRLFKGTDYATWDGMQDGG